MRGALRDARPYPFGLLPRWRRRDVALARALARRLGGSGRPGARGPADPGLDALLGGALRACPEAPRIADRAAVLRAHERASLCAVLATAGGCAAVVCDRPFALALAQRALGGPEELAVTHEPHGTLDPRWEGALTALVARLLARAFAPAAPPVVRAVTDDLADALDALGGDVFAAWPWALALPDLAGRAVALAPRDAAWPWPTASPSPRALGDLGVSVGVVAGRARWTARDVAALAVGEVLALDGLALVGGALTGDVAVGLGHPPALARAARLRDDGALVLLGPLESCMEQHDDDARLAELPLDVTVELAREPFPLAEVSAWRPGEVVSFRARLGDAVTLRANGRAVARGELVDVEGDVGVRIVELV